jgi:carboxypeptidase C (cathepsin A)
MKKILSSLAFVPLLVATFLGGADPSPPSSGSGQTAEKGELLPSEPSPFALADQVMLNNQSVSVNGKSITYEVRAGALTVRGKEEKDTADLSYIAYFAASDSPQHQRPIAFCFNGGPGSSSVWLHMGFLGPKTVDLRGMSHPPLPVLYKDNPHTLLTTCDLVFIDPVSTGFSTATNKGNPKKFHGVEEDLFSIADFIRLFLTKYNRWESPKLLIGESYGTLRAVGLASLLQDHYFIDINGLVLVSLVLDLQALEESPLMDLPCLTMLPTFAAIARYHQQLQPPLSQLPVQKVVEEAKKFATGEYGTALLQGTDASSEKKDLVAKRISEFTSLPLSTVSLHNLRISFSRFCKDFLKAQNLMIGRYDGRITAFRVPDETSSCGEIMSYPDPSFYSISGAFTSAFQSYLSNDLHWQKGEPYVMISGNVYPWNWTVAAQPTAGCGYLSFMQDLRVTMVKNPKLKVFVAAGYYDLATPYFSQEYSLTHLALPPKLQENIALKGYEAGHMIYLDEKAREVLFTDLVNFVQSIATQK